MTKHIPRAVDRSNAHPADELAEIRAEIKALQYREAELRARLLEDPADLIGSEYEAVIDEQTSRWLDREKLSAALGDLDPFKTDATCTVVRVKKRAYIRGGQ